MSAATCRPFRTNCMKYLSSVVVIIIVTVNIIHHHHYQIIITIVIVVIIIITIAAVVIVIIIIITIIIIILIINYRCSFLLNSPNSSSLSFGICLCKFMCYCIVAKALSQWSHKLQSLWPWVFTSAKQPTKRWILHKTIKYTKYFSARWQDADSGIGAHRADKWLDSLSNSDTTLGDLETWFHSQRLANTQ